MSGDAERTDISSVRTAVKPACASSARRRCSLAMLGAWPRARRGGELSRPPGTNPARAESYQHDGNQFKEQR